MSSRPSAAQYFKDPAIEESEERSKRFPLRLQMQNYARHFTPASSACIQASVEEVSYEQDDHVFILRVKFEDGNEYELCRIYDNFFKFQVLLKDIFPVEAGDTPAQDRTLPFMPGPVSPGELTQAISTKRRDNLNLYVHRLLEQPVHISRSLLVTTFFSPQNGYDRLLGNLPLQDIPQMQSQQYQRTSYRDRPNMMPSSNGDYNEHEDLLSPPMQQSYVDISNPHMSQDLKNSQHDTIQPPLAALKVKIYYGEDLFAIRVPNDIMFESLYDKVCDRLKIPLDQDVHMLYKDEKNGEKKPLGDNAALDEALARSEKLIIYVTAR